MKGVCRGIFRDTEQALIKKRFRKGKVMGKIKELFASRLVRASGKITVVMLTAGLVVGMPVWQNVVGAAAVRDYDADISDAENKIESIRKDNEARKAQIAGYTGDINSNKEAIKLISAQIDGVKDEIAAYGELITAKQDAIADKRIEIANTEQAIADKENEIAAKKERISDLKAENDRNLKQFSKLARVLYINDTSDTIPLLEGSDDWYSFFVYSDIVENISRQNLEFMYELLDSINKQESMIKELDDEITALNAKKQALVAEKLELEEKMSALEKEKSELQQYVEEQNEYLYELLSENEELTKKVSTLSYMIDASNEQVEALNSEIEELVRKKQAANANQIVYSSDGFRWPLDSGLNCITTIFGYDAEMSRNHYGIDVGDAGIGGCNIYAAQGGTVITAYNDGGYHGGFGNYVIIDHGDGVSTLYAHCSATTVIEGQAVNKGDVIGYVGTTGWSTGNHLHFEVRVNGISQNPFNYALEGYIKAW